MIGNIYKKMPRFVKGIWRGIRLEKYYQYGAEKYGFANVIGELSKRIAKGESYSQYGQDYYVLYLLFHGKAKGVFLDIGANDPVKINNTMLFEERGWTGLAFEPLKELADSWTKKRKTECINIAIGDKEKNIYFYEDGTLSKAVDRKEEATTVVKQRMLKNVLRERKIKRIDYISIDVEGHELEVLKGIDFNEVVINVILIENGGAESIKSNIVRKYLYNKGYVMIARLEEQDDIWMRRGYLNKYVKHRR